MARGGGSKAKRRDTAPAPAGGDADAANFRTIARNRRATFDYELLDRYEAGLVLRGTEIKSLRAGHASIAEAYVRPRDGEMWLVGATIPEYAPAGRESHDPTRDRKLLLHRREMQAISEAFSQQGLTVVPVRLYLTRGIAKLEIGVGRGKREYEKREAIQRREAEREMQRAVRR